MDGDIMRWMLEFLLRECTDGGLITRLLSNVRLPFPADGDNSRLKKTILLRSIQDELGKGSVSEDILDWLENLEEIDRRDELLVLESMKLAYCAVAVECTLRGGLLEEVVDKVWKLRVQRLIGKESELVTGEVTRLRVEVEMAISDLNARMVVEKWREKHNALKLVGDYLNEAFGIMGPSFLQLVEMKSRDQGRVNDVVNVEERVCNDDDDGRAECEVILNMNGDSDKPQEGPVNVLDGAVSVEEHLCDVDGGGTKGSHDVDDSMAQNIEKLNREKRKDIDSDILEGCSGKVAGSVTEKEQVCDCEPVELPDAGGREEGVDDSMPQNIEKLNRKKRKDIDSDIQEGCSGKVAGSVTGKERVCDGEPVEMPDARGREEGEDTIKKSEENKRRRKSASASDNRKHVSRRHGPVKIADVGESDSDGTGDLYVESRDGKNASGSATSNQGGPVVQGGKDDVVSPPDQIPASLPSASDKGKHVSHCHGPAKIADVDETRVLFVESKDGEIVEASTPATSNQGQGVPVTEGDKRVQPALDKQSEKHLDAEATKNVNDKGEGSVSSAGNRPQMETGRTLPVYPLNNYENQNLLTRRKKRKWSSEEETALINGVKQFGPGAWKDILSSRRDQFVDRSHVDLKDKWRNMTRFKR
ncbi:Telomere repeat-binding factor 5 [Linum grandiflorum]